MPGNPNFDYEEFFRQAYESTLESPEEIQMRKILDRPKTWTITEESYDYEIKGVGRFKGTFSKTVWYECDKSGKLVRVTQTAAQYLEIQLSGATRVYPSVSNVF